MRDASRMITTTRLERVRASSDNLARRTHPIGTSTRTCASRKCPSTRGAILGSLGARKTGRSPKAKAQRTPLAQEANMARKKRKRAHGQGCVYARGPNNWWIKWRERGRVRYSGAYETRELAEQVRAKIVADIAAGRAGLPLQEVPPPSLQRSRRTGSSAASAPIGQRRMTSAAGTSTSSRSSDGSRPARSTPQTSAGMSRRNSQAA